MASRPPPPPAFLPLSNSLVAGTPPQKTKRSKSNHPPALRALLIDQIQGCEALGQLRSIALQAVAAEKLCHATRRQCLSTPLWIVLDGQSCCRMWIGKFLKKWSRLGEPRGKCGPVLHIGGTNTFRKNGQKLGWTHCRFAEYTEQTSPRATDWGRQHWQWVKNPVHSTARSL